MYPRKQKNVVLVRITGETMIEVGDLVQRRGALRKGRVVHTPGVWLVTDRARYKALCAQGSKRRWFWLENLEKL
jgi:hypothetical protein